MKSLTLWCSESVVYKFGSGSALEKTADPDLISEIFVYLISDPTDSLKMQFNVPRTDPKHAYFE